MEPYEYMDPDDRKLTIWPRNASASTDALVRIYDGDFATITVKQSAVREIAGKLYEACGLPSPVILERPEITIPANGDSVRCGDLSLRMYDGGISMGLPGVTAAAISPDALRRRAAFMAAYAEQAEAEPDPEEVEALAKVLHVAVCESGGNCVQAPPDADRKRARAALQWQKSKAAEDA